MILAVSWLSLSFEWSQISSFSFYAVTSYGPKMRQNLGKDICVIHFQEESSASSIL